MSETENIKKLLREIEDDFYRKQSAPDFMLVVILCLSVYGVAFIHGQTALCINTCKGLQFENSNVDKYDGVNVCECW